MITHHIISDKELARIERLSRVIDVKSAVHEDVYPDTVEIRCIVSQVRNDQESMTKKTQRGQATADKAKVDIKEPAKQ